MAQRFARYDMLINYAIIFTLPALPFKPEHCSVYLLLLDGDRSYTILCAVYI